MAKRETRAQEKPAARRTSGAAGTIKMILGAPARPFGPPGASELEVGGLTAAEALPVVDRFIAAGRTGVDPVLVGEMAAQVEAFVARLRLALGAPEPQVAAGVTRHWTGEGACDMASEQAARLLAAITTMNDVGDSVIAALKAKDEQFRALVEESAGDKQAMLDGLAQIEAQNEEFRSAVMSGTPVDPGDGGTGGETGEVIEPGDGTVDEGGEGGGGTVPDVENPRSRRRR